MCFGNIRMNSRSRGLPSCLCDPSACIKIVLPKLSAVDPPRHYLIVFCNQVRKLVALNLSLIFSQVKSRSLTSDVWTQHPKLLTYVECESQTRLHQTPHKVLESRILIKATNMHVVLTLPCLQLTSVDECRNFSLGSTFVHILWNLSHTLLLAALSMVQVHLAQSEGQIGQVVGFVLLQCLLVDPSHYSWFCTLMTP